MNKNNPLKNRIIDKSKIIVYNTKIEKNRKIMIVFLIQNQRCQQVPVYLKSQAIFQVLV